MRIAVQSGRPSRPPPVDCIVGDTLRRVRVLTEAEWEAIPLDRRPAPAEYFPGLGWLVAGSVRID
jgi:hypothetical protein